MGGFLFLTSIYCYEHFQIYRKVERLVNTHVSICELPLGAVTNDNKHGGFRQQTCNLLQFWRPDVQNQGLQGCAPSLWSDTTVSVWLGGAGWLYSPAARSGVFVRPDQLEVIRALATVISLGMGV